MADCDNLDPSYGVGTKVYSTVPNNKRKLYVDERYVDERVLDELGAELMTRAQQAIRVSLDSGVHATDAQEHAVGENILRQHEWEIATNLRRLTRLRAEHERARARAAESGPMTDSILTSHQNALTVAQESITSRIAALEHYAAQLHAADAAKNDWLEALKLSGLNDAYRDLVARTAADEHAIAEIKGMTEQAAAAAQVFQDSLHEVTLAAEALVLPEDYKDRA